MCMISMLMNAPNSLFYSCLYNLKLLSKLFVMNAQNYSELFIYSYSFAYSYKLFS